MKFAHLTEVVLGGFIYNHSCRIKDVGVSENDEMSDFFIFAYSYSIRGYLPYVNVTKLDLMLKLSSFDVLNIISSLTK